MKRKVFSFGLTGALLVMFLAGCPNPTSSDKPLPGPDTSVLDAGVAAAETAKAGVLVGVQATIAQGMAYVSQADLDALAAAISAAKAVRNNGSATQEAVNDAVATLATAVQTFTGRIKADGTKGSGFNDTELNTLIATANAAKQGVVTSANGTNINPSVYWVTQEVLNAFNTAITAAGGSGSIDSRYTALVAAINTFKAELRPGAKAKTVTITGLSAYADGAEIQAGLFETKSLQGNPQIAGMGTIQNGSATVPLYVRSSDSAWAGTGAWYVAFAIQDEEVFHITKTAKSFSADNVNVALSECDQEAGSGSNDNRGEQIGEIKGTITLTNIPTPRPSRVSISAYERNGNWRAIDRSISLSNASGNTASNIAWTIPLYEHDSNGSLQGQTGTKEVVFYLYVSTGNNSGYSIDIPGNKTLDLSNLSNMDMGNLGSVSLASVTLSGTINVTLNGQTVPRVNIVGNTPQGGWAGSVDLTTPGANASWSIILPAFESPTDITLNVYGYDANWDQQLFGRSNVTSLTGITNTDRTGIVINLGSIDTVALSGTVTFAGAPPASSTIRIAARYGAGNNQQWMNNGSSYSVTVSGVTGTWTITGDEAFLAALNSGSQTVDFVLRVQPDTINSAVSLPGITKTVSKDALTGINLGSVNIALVTLSGTITATNAGQLIPRLDISALNAGGQSQGYTSIQPTAATTQWTMIIPAQQGGAVTFRVYGYDSTGGGGNQLISKTFTPSQTALVTDQPISGIAFDVGDVSVGRLSGTITFTSMHSPAPNEILVQAYTYYPKSGSSSNRTTMEDTSYTTIAINGNAGTWTTPKNDKFLAELEKENQNVTFYVAVRINQNENLFDVTQVTVEVDKNNLSNISLGSIAIPQYIKLSGSFTGSYDGASLSQAAIYASGETSGDRLGSSAYINSPVAPGSPWSLYMPASASPIKVVFHVSSYNNNTTLFNITVPHSQTESVSNQDVSGIAIDIGNIVPNTLRVANPPSGSYTAYVSETSINQTNYPSISQSGNHVASGNGSGSSISLSWTSGPDNYSKYVLITAANGVTKYSSWTTFVNGVGVVDWNAMIEAVGSKLTIAGNPPSGQLTAYAHSGVQITNTNYATVLDTYRAIGTGASPILLAWTSGWGEGTYNVLIKTGSDEYWYKNSVSFTGGSGVITWSEMEKVTTAQQLPAPENFRVTNTTSNSISLAWNSVSGGVSYKVYRSASSSGTYTAFGNAISGASVVVSALNPDTTYYFKVAAVASNGTEGAQSSVLSGKTASDDLYLEIDNVAGNTAVKITTATISSGTVFDDLTGVVATGQGDHPKLTWITGAERTKVYNVMLRLVNSPNTVKYQNGVQFTNGSGTVNWNSMSTIEGGGPATGNDTLSLSNGPGNYYVYVTTTTLSSSSTVTSATSGLQATGTGSGSSATLAWISGESSGSYNVLIYTGTETKYSNNVSFSNGSASLNWNSMSTAGGSSGGSFTISGLPSGSYNVYVLTGNPSTYMDFATMMGSAGIAGLGAIYDTTFAWGTAPSNGTYTIILVNSDTPTTAEKATNVSISGGGGSVAYSSFVALPFN
jgi:hypothetical protein